MLFPFGYIELADISIASRTRYCLDSPKSVGPQFIYVCAHAIRYPNESTTILRHANKRKKKSFIYFQHALFQRTVVFVATINIQQRREIEYLRLQQQAVCDAHTATAAGEGEPGGGKKETCKLCCVYVIQPKFMASFDSHIDTVYPVSATHRS